VQIFFVRKSRAVSALTALAAGFGMCVGTILASPASAQTTAAVSGTISANFSQTAKGNGTISYSFLNDTYSLGVSLPPVAISADATAQPLNWSSPSSWVDPGIALDTSGVTVSSFVGGAPLTPGLAAMGNTSGTMSSVTNSGPTEGSLAISLPLAISNSSANPTVNVSAGLQFDVTIPTADQMTMDQPNVVLQALTVDQGASLVGNGGFTVRTDLSNDGSLVNFGGTIQGNLYNSAALPGQSGGTIDVTAPLTVDGSVFNSGAISIESGAALNVAQSTENNGTIVLDGGSLGVPGALTNDGMLRTNSGTIPNVTNAPGGIVALEAGTLSLAQTLDNPAGGTIDFRGDGTLTGNDGSITNGGLLKKSAGTGRSVISGITIANTGTIEVDSGTLELDGQSADDSDGATLTSTNGNFEFSNGGQLNVSNAVVQFSGTNTSSGSGSMVFSTGNPTTVEAVAGQSATLNFASGNMVWTDDTFVGAGLTNAGVLQVAAVTDPVYLNASLTNTGTINHTEGELGVSDGVTLNNQGTYLLSGTGYTYVRGVGYSGSLFNNTGMLQKAGSGTATLDGGVYLQNTGTVEVDGGTFILGGGDGSPDLSSTASSSNGTFRFSNGGQLLLCSTFLTLSGTNTGSGNGDLGFSTVYTPNTIEAASGQTATLNFANCDLILTQDTNIGPGLINAGFMQISPVDVPVTLYTGATFTNNGTIQHTQGTFGLSDGSTLNNQGLYQISGGAEVGVIANGDPLFVNSGTIQKIGVGTATIDDGVPIQNTGTVEVDAGTLQIGSTYTGTINGTLTVLAGGELDLQNTFSQPAPILNNGKLSVSGTGSMGKLTGTGTLAVQYGATLTLSPKSGTSQQGGLSIDPAGTLDINDNTLVINYGVGNPSPVATIGGYIGLGYNGGTFTGVGIISSMVAAVNAKDRDPTLFAIGYADGSDVAVAGRKGFAPGTVVIEPAIVGDANLDGVVNFTDFQLLAANFNRTGTTWDEADFNYSGKTNFTDFQLLAANFNDSTSLDAAEFGAMNQVALSNGFRMTPNADGLGFGFTAVPGPVMGPLLVILGAGVLKRRRRNAGE
jgi:hypothetical protein